MKPKDSDYIAPCTATSIYTWAPSISGLRSYLMRTLLMMIRWRANECVEEEDDDDHCGVGGDGGWKWTQTERWGVVQVSSSPEREVREGIKEQEEGKGSVRATWEVGEESHVLSRYGFYYWIFPFFSFTFHLGLWHLIRRETKRERKHKHNQPYKSRKTL